MSGFVSPQPLPLDPAADIVAAVHAACDRLDQIDPAIQAFLPEPDRRQRLDREARALEARYPDRWARPALCGVPIAVKDIFRVDGFPTRAGSSLPPDIFEGPEASVVRCLKAHGALILGKAVATEFAYFEPGPTRNPHHPDHTPGGSSSGSAAAVAAGLCALALGTQTIGSVIRPASYCGVVGFKPSFGRIPTDGVIPISASLDHVGLFTADAQSMRLAAALLVNGWRAPVAAAGFGPRPPVIGIPLGPYLNQAEPEARAVLDVEIERLRNSGQTVIEVPMFEDLDAITAHNRQIMSAEMASVHRRWFTEYEARYRPRTAGLIREGQQVTPAQLAAAHQAQVALRQRIESAMDAHTIDLWLCPAATGPAPRGLLSTGSPVMSLPWTQAGLPALTCPGGTSEAGLPIGLQWVARFGADEQLLGWAVLQH